MAAEWRPDQIFEETLVRGQKNVSPNLLDGQSPQPTLLGGDPQTVAATARGVASVVGTIEFAYGVVHYVYVAVLCSTRADRVPARLLEWYPSASRRGLVL